MFIKHPTVEPWTSHDGCTSGFEAKPRIQNGGLVVNILQTPGLSESGIVTKGFKKNVVGQQFSFWETLAVADVSMFIRVPVLTFQRTPSLLLGKSGGPEREP